MTPTPKAKNKLLHSRNRLIGMALVGCSVFTLTACSSDSDAGNAKPSDTVSKSPKEVAPSKTSDPRAAAEKEVLDAYDRMWAEQVKAYAKADPKGTKLSTYSAAVALAQTKNDLKGLKAKGIITTGKPSHDVKVTGMKPDKQVPSAGLSDCLDTAGWKFVYRKSGKAVAMPENQLKSYVMEIQAEKWGKQWKIVDVKPQDRAC